MDSEKAERAAEVRAMLAGCVVRREHQGSRWEIWHEGYQERVAGPQEYTEEWGLIRGGIFWPTKREATAVLERMRRYWAQLEEPVL